MFMPKAYEGQKPYIFVSYAHLDSDRVLPIIQALQNRGFRVWYDAGIEAGTEWPEYIATRLDGCTCFLALISKNAVDSHNCRREINFAIELCKDPLAIYLEDVELSRGMRMQLGTLQAMFYNRHNSMDAFLDALVSSRMLAPCKGAEPVNTKHMPPVVDERNPASLYSRGQQFESEKNYQNAVIWYTKAADLGHTDAQFRLGDIYAQGLEVTLDYSQAVKWFRTAAENGNADAALRLHEMYQNGFAVPEDHDEASKWYRTAAENGNLDAQLSLGSRSKKAADAIMWYRMAAENGSVDAMYKIGSIYETGSVDTLLSAFEDGYEGVTKDWLEAVKWYKTAAQNGSKYAIERLGWLSETGGNGLEQDYNEAAKYYRMMEDHDQILAWIRIAHLYTKGGNGMKQDYSQAAKWYRKAAENGNSFGQYCLAKLYEEGKGVARNGKEALFWYRKAAEQGNDEGGKGMGRCFEKGFGVDKDLQIALKWYELARSGADMYRLKKLLNIPMPERSYTIVDDNGNPIDMSIYSYPLVSVFKSPLTKCRWCGGRHNPANGNICPICGGNND